MSGVTKGLNPIVMGACVVGAIVAVSVVPFLCVFTFGVICMIVKHICTYFGLC